MSVQRVLIEVDLHLPRRAAIAIGQLGARHSRQLRSDEILREIEKLGLRKRVARQRELDDRNGPPASASGSFARPM